MTDDGCAFCSIPEEQVVERRGPCVAIWTDEAPEGSAMVIPVQHRRDPWDLTADEWAATHDLLRVMRDLVTSRHGPQGWNVGWNVGETGGQVVPHAHCHLVPRYADERFAGRGMRWWIKQPDNARGTGRRLSE